MAYEGIRKNISLSSFELRILIIWAKLHNKPVATYVSQILGSQVEENVELVYKLLENEARSQGISPEELEKKWLEEEGFPLQSSSK